MTVGGVDSVYLRRNTPELTATETCSGTVECALAGVADQVLVAMWLGMMVVVALATLVFLPRAREYCARERDRTQAEYDAFDQFLNDVQDIPASSTASAVEPAGEMSIVQTYVHPSGAGKQRLREAYEGSVMSVPHFSEDYDETIDENMAAEFGDEIAHAALNGQEFGPHVKRSLLQGAVDARERRRHFLTLLEAESASLNRHADRLADVKRRVDRASEPLCADLSFDELTANRECLADCEDAIEGVVEHRQSDRTEGKNAVLRLNKDLDLQEYLYQPMEVTYPVLAEAARLLSQIAIATRRIEDELIYRA